MEKKRLRKAMKEKLVEMSDETYWQFSNAIHNQLISLSNWQKAETIAVTISTGKEVDTKKLIEKAWFEKKRIVVPKCDPTSNSMVFRELTSFKQLEHVFYNLLEPKVEETNIIDSNDIDLMIVPGVCFNREGYRIGYGGGYYDRYLLNFNSTTVSLSFSFQIVDDLQIEAHDIPVSTIITESEVINVYA